MRRVLSVRWLALHALLLVLAASFVALGWWQWDRAHAGNLLSWAYAFEWPIFAAFTLAFWAKLVRDAIRPPAEAPSPAAPVTLPPRPTTPPPVTDADDPELAAYNRYLAALNDDRSMEV